MKQSKDIGTNTKLVNYRASAYKPFNNFQMTACLASILNMIWVVVSCRSY